MESKIEVGGKGSFACDNSEFVNQKPPALVKKKALEHITRCIDSEWHGEGYPVMAEVIWDGICQLFKVKLPENPLKDKIVDGSSEYEVGWNCGCNQTLQRVKESLKQQGIEVE